MQMLPVKVYIEGIRRQQADELLRELNSISDIEAGFYVQESGLEFKEAVVPIVISLGKDIAIGVVTGLITHYLMNFLDKQKSVDDKPIIIKNQQINIVQGDSKEKIESQISIIFSKK